MKFDRLDDNNIQVKFKDSKGEYNFDYIKMIKYLYKGQQFDAPEYSESISKKEREKIEEMINKINSCIHENDSNLK
jgi:hypothetical protein